MSGRIFKPNSNQKQQIEKYPEIKSNKEREITTGKVAGKDKVAD